jgi:UDP-glucose 4-epimerase
MSRSTFVLAMGTSKAMMEKVIVAKSRTTEKTKICCTRYGNVMCSCGLVIPLWIDQIKAGNPITIMEFHRQKSNVVVKRFCNTCG